MLAKGNKKLEASLNRYETFRGMANPLKLGSRFSRTILRESMKGSEGNNGLQMLETLSRPTMTLTKRYVINTVPNTIYIFICSGC